MLPVINNEQPHKDSLKIEGFKANVCHFGVMATG